MSDLFEGLSGSQVLFFAFALLAGFSALAMVTRRNVVTAAVWLVASFLGVAGCYVLMHASFLAAIQVLVYAGAMMVLFVFVIMVLDVDETGELQQRRPGGSMLYVLASLSAIGFMAWVFGGTWTRQYVQTGAALPEGFGTADALGRELFAPYLFGFEAVSLLLLAAVIGAVVVARSRKEREQDDDDLDPRTRAKKDAGLLGDREGAGPQPMRDFGKASATGHQGG